MNMREELSRGGSPIFEDLTIGVMEDHEDDVPVCDENDGRPATARVMCAACRHGQLVCAKHEAWCLTHLNKPRLACTLCGARGDGVCKVVPL